MKDNLEFYQHYTDADQHPKFKMLRVQFGWSGEGKFWALNNRIAQAKGCKLDISKKYNKAAVASDLNFNIKEFDEYIDFLIHDCELVDEVEAGVITTEIVQENYLRVDINRLKARERKQRYLEKVHKGSGELSEGSGEQNNKGKGKGKGKSKGKKELEKINKEFLGYLQEKIIEFNLSHFQIKIIEFFNFRMAKNQADRYQSTKGLDGLVRNVSGLLSLNYPVDQCIDIAMEAKGGAGWQTPNPTYYDSYNFGKKPTKLNGRSEQNAQACQEFING